MEDELTSLSHNSVAERGSLLDNKVNQARCQADTLDRRHLCQRDCTKDMAVGAVVVSLARGLQAGDEK